MLKPPFFYRNLFSDIPASPQLQTKNIYLTFDDGPAPEITEFIIDILNKYDAKATFFCVGNNIEEYNKEFEILKLNKQHSIGNHTCNHINGWKTKNIIYYEDVFKFNQYHETLLFRPPYGKLTFPQLRYLKEYFKIYLFDLLSYDFNESTTPEKCLKNVIKNAKANSIIVFHDSVKAQKNLFYALPRTLEHLSEKGYSFLNL